MVLGIQILGLLFGVFMVYFTFINFKRKEFRFFEFCVWSVLWLIVMFVALFPNSLDFLVKDILRLKRPLDFFIISGFLFLVFLSFISYTLTLKNSKKIERIVSQAALRNAEKEEKR